MQRLAYNPGPLQNPSTGTVIVLGLSAVALGLVGYGIYRHVTKPKTTSPFEGFGEPQRVH